MIITALKILSESSIEVLDFIRHVVKYFGWAILVLLILGGITFADIIYIKNQDGTITKQEVLSAGLLANRRDYVAGRIADLRDRNISLLNAIQSNQTELDSLSAELLQIDAATTKP